MKTIALILIQIFLLNFYISSQNIEKFKYEIDTIESLKWLKIDDLLRFGINEYINKTAYSFYKGIIVVKMVSVSENSFKFSLTKVINLDDLKDFEPFSSYMYINKILILIRSSETFEEEICEKRIFKHLHYNEFEESEIKKNYQHLCMDGYMIEDDKKYGVIKYKNEYIELSIYPSHLLPKEFEVENFFKNF